MQERHGERGHATGCTVAPHNAQETTLLLIVATAAVD